MSQTLSSAKFDVNGESNEELFNFHPVNKIKKAFSPKLPDQAILMGEN